MTDNETVTISADYFAKLHRLANETINICKECREEHTAEEFNALKKERDELKAKFAAAERCIEDIEPLIGEYTVGDCYPHGPAGEKMLNIILAYRAAKEVK